MVASDTTPLDLLLNAISGSATDYTTGSHTDGPAVLLQGSQKRRHDSDIVCPRAAKIAKTLLDHVVLHRATAVGTGDAVSSIEVWHPRAGQKSYAKERRMLNPPPTLRMTGPLLSSVTSATLSTIIVSNIPTIPPLSLSSQTHNIPLAIEAPVSPPATPATKKAERQLETRRIRDAAARSGLGGALPWERSKRVVREREVLRDGLTFPGLWVSDLVGKGKEFQFELTLGPPGHEVATEDVHVKRRSGRPKKTAAANDATDTVEAENGIDIRIDSLHGAADAENNADISRKTDFNPAELAELVDVGNSSAFVIDPDLNQGLDEQLQNEDTLIGTDDPKREESAPTTAEAPDEATTAVPTLAEPPSTPWATFFSSPMTIVSKPSTKTSKARTIANCLRRSDSVALMVRINHQTVRTRYMKMDESDPVALRLTSRTGLWSPFKLEVEHHAQQPTNNGRDEEVPDASDILTYGSIVRIVDVQSGIRSDPVRLVKVELNASIQGGDVGRPVSELQRVAFLRIDGVHEGDRWYLSAPGARAGGVELQDPPEDSKPATPLPVEPIHEPPAPEPSLHHFIDAIDGPSFLGDVPELPPQEPQQQEATPQPPAEETKSKKRRTKRMALAKAVVEEQDENSTNMVLSWAKAVSEERMISLGKKSTEQRMAVVDKVEDWMCWVITGVSSFKCSFVDINDPGHLPLTPIEHIPRNLTPPEYDALSNTLDIYLAQYDPLSPLKVYVGSLGPLHLSTWRSTLPAGPLKVHEPYPAVRLDGQEELINGRQIRSAWPSQIRHTMLVVEMPDLSEVVEALQAMERGVKEQEEEVKEPEQSVVPVDTNEADPDQWISDTAGELTIQEALQNAENALHGELGMDVLAETQDNAQIEELAKVEEQPATIGLSLPERSEDRGKVLPIMLVRGEDGMGFGIGYGVSVGRDGAVRVVPT